MLSINDNLSFTKPIKVIHGNVINALKILPSQSIDCVITSPPYWMQRDYGDPDQIGREQTSEEYVTKLTSVFSEIHRVLRRTGTLFLNIGDKYQDKNLLMIPERLAISLQQNGWVLRNKIIWYKPNAMPASVKDRLTTTYEPIYFFVKDDGAQIYYFYLNAIRERPKTIDDYQFNKSFREILGMRVVDNIRGVANLKGIIKGGIFDSEERLTGAVVSWGEKTTKEYLHDMSKSYPLEVEYKCPKCGSRIENLYLVYTYETLLCSCGAEILSDLDSLPIPILPPLPEFKEEIIKDDVKEKTNQFNSKYTNAGENKGTSPRGRIVAIGEHYTVQRRYKIFQPFISQYLNLWRIERGYGIKEINDFFNRKDTASRWFSRNFGKGSERGSVPLPNDWLQLKQLLRFDDRYDELVTRTHLVLYTVRVNPEGKNIGDLWQINTRPFEDSHFAVFPEELVERCIKVGCPKNGTVLDPFAGSGTTGAVALKLQRKAVLIELVDEYINIIKKRCNNEVEVISIGDSNIHDKLYIPEK